jgi:Dehydrogenases with different specificities (related to short-chain alcohol dehydrogenases)
MDKLQDKVAIITGGAGGIGKGIAKAFVKEGAKVVIVDLNEEAGQETLKDLQQYQKDCLFIQANLMEHAKLPEIVKKVADAFGKIDILINNAHASKMAAIEKIGKDELELSFGTGFYPTLIFMQAALPYLKETKGKIINFASGAGINGDVNQGSYAAAKEAIRGISRVAANEFGPFGITVNLISPIAKSEGMLEWAKANPEYYQNMIAKIPLRRLGEIEEDIGRTVVFLASSDADYITGQTIMVDGGATKLR